MIYDVLVGMLLSANARPRLSPSAHLWHTTAKLIAITSLVSSANPIDKPSKTAWIPTATYNKYGPISVFYYYSDIVFLTIDILVLYATLDYVLMIDLNAYSSYYSSYSISYLSINNAELSTQLFLLLYNYEMF